MIPLSCLFRFFAPRISIQRMQLVKGSPCLLTAMVPSPCVEQQTAKTSLATSEFLRRRRFEASIKACHHSCGDCSVPPSWVRISSKGSLSHPNTCPSTLISATFTLEVPISTDSMIFSAFIRNPYCAVGNCCISFICLIRNRQTTSNAVAKRREGVKEPSFVRMASIT